MSKRSALVAATVCSLACAGLVAVPAHAESNDGTCQLTSATVTASASYNTGLNTLFTTYGNTSGQWVGADSTYSVPLKDGSTAWLFSDTLYGDVTNNKLSPTDSFFLNNTILQQRGSSLRTITNGTADAPTSLVPMRGTAWHWFGDGELRPNGDLQVGVLRYDRFGAGPWDWGWDSSQIATFDTRSWKLKSLSPLPSAEGIQWASWYYTDDNTLYAYGVEDLGATKYAHVAKVLGRDLARTQNWRYWTGEGWSKNEADSARLLAGVANEYSVTRFHDGYLMVTQDTTEAFSNRVVGYTSCSPTGPFVNKVDLFRMQEVGAWGSYGDPNIFAYNAHEHPQLRSGDRLVVSYNVNSFDSSKLYDDVSIYRPRFMDVTLTVTHG